MHGNQGPEHNSAESITESIQASPDFNGNPGLFHSPARRQKGLFAISCGCSCIPCASVPFHGTRRTAWRLSGVIPVQEGNECRITGQREEIPASICDSRRNGVEWRCCPNSSTRCSLAYIRPWDHPSNHLPTFTAGVFPVDGTSHPSPPATPSRASRMTGLQSRQLAAASLLEPFQEHEETAGIDRGQPQQARPQLIRAEDHQYGQSRPHQPE